MADDEGDFYRLYAAKKRKRTTGKMCSVVGCTGKNSDGLSVHSFPSDPTVRRQWIAFVRTHRADFTAPTTNNYVCERHFEPQCYPDTYRLQTEFGLTVNRKALKSGSVPTIFQTTWIADSDFVSTSMTSTTCTTTTTTTRSSSSTLVTALERPVVSTYIHQLPGTSKPRGAYAKRQQQRVIAELLLNHTSASGDVVKPSKKADASIQTEFDSKYTKLASPALALPSGKSVHVVLPSGRSVHVVLPSGRSVPVALSSGSSDPVTLSSVSSDPVALSSGSSDPVTLSSVSSDPVALSSGSSVTFTLSSGSSVPITLSSGSSDPVALSSGSSVPVTLSSGSSDPVALSSGSSVPIALSSGSSDPVTLSSGSSNPIALSSGSSDPVALSSGSSDLVALSSGSSVPVALSSGSSDPVALSSGSSDPVALSSGNSDPVARRRSLKSKWRKGPQKRRRTGNHVLNDRCPLRYSTCEGIRMEWLDSDGWVAQPNSAISSITQTAVDRPHSCQRCSATFVLASSLRTHAAHIHGDGLQALLAESGCHSCCDLTNHGDTTCHYIEPDKIKMEVCEEDSIHSSTLVSDNQTRSSHVHGDNVTDSHPGIFDDTTCDIKSDKIKIEICEEDSIQSNTLMSDNQTCSNNAHGDNVTDSRSGIFDDTTCDIKPVKIKMEVCEEDSVHNNTLVSGTQTRSTSSHVHGKNVTDSHPGILDNPADDIQVDRIRIEMCQEDRERSSTLIPDSQTHVTDVHSKRVTGSLRKRERSHKNDRPYSCTVCKKTFNRACSLRKHERSHTKGTHCACCM